MEKRQLYKVTGNVAQVGIRSCLVVAETFEEASGNAAEALAESRSTPYMPPSVDRVLSITEVTIVEHTVIV